MSRLEAALDLEPGRLDLPPDRARKGDVVGRFEELVGAPPEVPLRTPVGCFGRVPPCAATRAARRRSCFFPPRPQSVSTLGEPSLRGVVGLAG